MDWDKLQYPAGTEVNVLDIYNKPLGVGTLRNDYDHDDPDQPMPEIAMENGKTLFGYECWWIPVEEASKGQSGTDINDMKGELE